MPYRLAALVFAGALGLLPTAASAQTVVVEPPAVVVPSGPLTIDDARAVAFDHGMRRIEEIELDRDANRWEVDGRDVYDRWVEMDIDANTGAVLRIDR